MWVAHSIVSFILPLMAFSQDNQPCAEDHYHEQAYQSPRIKQQYSYAFDSCGEKVCASDGYRYASFDHICHLTEFNMQLLIAEQPEFIETDPYYCEQPQRSLSYNRLPFAISSYLPYSPTVAKESAIMQNIKYRPNNIHLQYPSRHYYQHPISRSFEHAAAQTSAIVTTKLGQIGAQRTVYWQQPNQNQHLSYYDQTVGQTLSNAYPSYTNLAASQYSIPSSNVNTYEPKVEPISPNTTTTSDPNTTTESTTNAPNTTAISTTNAPNITTTSTTVSPTPTTTTTTSSTIAANTTATSTENPSTTEATSTTVSSSAEVNVTPPTTTNTPNITIISTTIFPNITTPLGGINPVSPSATTDPNPIISTTGDLSTTTTSTTISPNTTTSTTTDPNATTISTTTSPNITTILTTVAPNTTTFPTTTLSTTTSPTRIISTTTASTTTSPTTIISTTTFPTTTTSTTTSPTTPISTINATTTSTNIFPTTTIAANAAATIEPNTTSSTATSATTPPSATATTTSSLYYRNATVTKSYNTIEPITITIQQSNGNVLSFVLTPLGADGAGYPTCNPTSTAQITKGSQMLFKFTGCSKTNSSAISKPTDSPISYPTEPANVPIYRSPPAPNTKRSPYYYNAAAASGATCAHSYASRIIYNY